MWGKGRTAAARSRKWGVQPKSHSFFSCCSGRLLRQQSWVLLCAGRARAEVRANTGQEARLQGVREVGAVGVMITQHQHFQHFLSAAPAIRFGCVDLPRSSCNSLIIQHYLLPDWNTELLFCVHSLQEGKNWQRLWLGQASCVQTVQLAVHVAHSQEPFS